MSGKEGRKELHYCHQSLLIHQSNSILSFISEFHHVSLILSSLFGPEKNKIKCNSSEHRSRITCHDMSILPNQWQKKIKATIMTVRCIPKITTRRHRYFCSWIHSWIIREAKLEFFDLNKQLLFVFLPFVSQIFLLKSDLPYNDREKRLSRLNMTPITRLVSAHMVQYLVLKRHLGFGSHR